MKINKYPDGTSYVTIPKEWENTFQNITFRINTYTDVIHLAQLCDVLKFNRVEASITIPCLLDAQADKRFKDTDSSGLAVISDILTNYSKEGDICFNIFHPHNPEVVEALFNCVNIIDNSEFIKKVLWELNIVLEEDEPILMSSDAGGFKPLMKLCDKINWGGETYSASKYRNPSILDGKNRLTQQIDRQDFKGKDVLIIDDISVYGGTFKGLAKMLRERNVGKLYLAVSHMTVQNLGEDPVTNYFDKVFTTNSKFDEYWYDIEPTTKGSMFKPRNLKIVKLF